MPTRREDERHDREGADQQRQRARHLELLRHQVVDRRDIEKRQARVQLANDLPDRGQDASQDRGSSAASDTENDRPSARRRRPGWACPGPAYFTSLTTPTTVVHGQSVQPPSRNRWPTASPFGKNRLAQARSTTTTGGSVERIPLVEEAAFHEGEAEEPKVLRRHADPRRDGLDLSRRRRRRLQVEVVVVVHVARRSTVRERDPRHAGKRLGTSLELVPEGGGAPVFADRRTPGRRMPPVKQVAAVEAQIHPLAARRGWPQAAPRRRAAAWRRRTGSPTSTRRRRRTADAARRRPAQGAQRLAPPGRRSRAGPGRGRREGRSATVRAGQAATARARRARSPGCEG